MRTSPLPADFIHARACKPICEKYLTLPLTHFLYKNPAAAVSNSCRRVLFLTIKEGSFPIGKLPFFDFETGYFIVKWFAA